MSETKSLKDQNAWLIRATMIGHALAFAWIALEPTRLFGTGAASLGSKLEALTVPGSASLGLIVIASLLLLGLIPSTLRDRIIHLRWHHPLPGSRAFSKIGPETAQVDMQRLEEKHGPFPEDPAAQNQLFYRVYKPLRDDVGVCDSHRRYLAARDIGTITALLMIPLPILAFLATGNFVRSVVYGLLLVVTFLLCAVAAKNYSLRMVQHVLALTGATASTD